MAGRVASVGHKRDLNRGKFEGRRSRRVDNIKVMLKKYDGRAWTGLM